MCRWMIPGGAARLAWGSFVLVSLLTASRALAVDPNTKLDGYRGIWFSIGQVNDWGPKYSGGLGTYTAKHRPIAVYAPQVHKTFFTYGGVEDNGSDLLIMASYYDHATCEVPRPTVVHHKVGVNDPHDNAALLIDRDGYLWIFISGRGRARTGWIYRSVEPYSTDAFEWKRGGSGENFFEITYPQPWYITAGVEPPVFFHMFTRYTAGRELYWATSTDGVNWSDDAGPPAQGTKLVGFSGHYQSSAEWNGKIVTFCNYHPGGSVDARTNLYYLQTTDLGQTWTTADGTPLTVPLSSPNNPALIRNYQAEGRNVYVKDTNFDADGNPMHIHVTSGGWAAGPSNDPRTWTFVRWDGTQWLFSDITQSDHNYDMGSLYVEGDTLRVIAPTETGPQPYGTGGEVAVWISSDMGLTWRKVQDATTSSVYNHTYVRRPVNARDPFYAYWADGNPLQRTESRLYFADRSGAHVWRLPATMDGDFARPERITDFGGIGGTPLWRSRFETASDVPVTHGQTAVQIANSVGEAGVTVGDSSLTYAAYGQPGVGAAPAAGAGSFSLSFPNDRTLGINTHLPSNAGGLTDALTFEGLFRTPEASPIQSPSSVGRRLVTQKRQDGDGSSRLAIGLHAGTTVVTGGLWDYEGFDYSGTAIDGKNGGIGWNGAWSDDDGNFAVLSNDDTSLDIPGTFPFMPVGDRITRGAGTSGIEAVRPIRSPLSLSGNGNVMYLSYLMKKNSTGAGTGDNIEVSFDAGGTTSIFRTGMSSDDHFFMALSGGVTTRGTADVVAGATYFVVVKLVSSASGNDTANLAFFESGDMVPETEAGITWEVTATGTSSSVLSRLRLTYGANADGDIDEVRIGTDYQSVTDPEAPIAGGGSANVLALYWRSLTGADHLELGTTAVQPDTWYHFAVTYDGDDIQWYLDGLLQGTVANANIVDPGPFEVAIGNNRINGEDDRGFYGLIDLVRISDEALAPAEFLLNGGSCSTSCADASGGGTLWCSGFETDPDAPATHNQPVSQTCAAIRNEYGMGGTPAGASSLSYVAYGEAGIGDAPAPAAGSLAISFPDDRSLAIDTHLTSDAGDLQNAVTFEGFFNSFDAAPITSPSSVGRRLVSQKRSALETESRLAIGLHARPGGAYNVLSVFWQNASGINSIEPGVTPIQPNIWHHFALTWDGASITWYLDGEVEGNVPAADLTAAGSANLVIGNNRGSGVADRGFYGLIDEVRIVDAALAPEDFLLPHEGVSAGSDCLPGCPFPFADADEDGDVDQADFGEFQICYTEVGGLGVINPVFCHCFDRDGDDDVDAEDFDEYLACQSGPAIPWTQGLAPACNP